MKDLLRNGILVVAIIASIVACSGKRARLIPSDRLSEIYAEMFLVDQWIKADRHLSRIADTMLVYEPVFNKYGYTTEDFRHTVEVYRTKPDKFAKVFNTTATMLRTRVNELIMEENLRRQLDSLKKETNSRDWDRFVAGEFDSLMVSPGIIDSIMGIVAVLPPYSDSVVIAKIDTLLSEKPDSAARPVTAIDGLRGRRLPPVMPKDRKVLEID
ncbi:MAG: DUF4296 domain-containing protein [Candidatus Cryptobacteroides sp.]